MNTLTTEQTVLGKGIGDYPEGKMRPYMLDVHKQATQKGHEGLAKILETIIKITDQGFLLTQSVQHDVEMPGFSADDSLPHRKTAEASALKDQRTSRAVGAILGRP